MKKSKKSLPIKQMKTLEIKSKPIGFSPGPGQYDISLPIIKPSYEAIKKKNDMIIIKVHHHGESASFRGYNRFTDDKSLSPGPGRYSINQSTKPKQREHKKYSQRYKDLVQFMYHDRTKIQPIPDYRVAYNEQYEENLKYIKNSYRKLRKKSSEAIEINSISPYKQTIATKSIVSINSSRVYDYDRTNNKQQSSQERLELKTIDYPIPVTELNHTKRFKKQDSLVMHRRTFFNRNMVGMMVYKQRSAAKRSKNKLNGKFQSLNSQQVL